MKTRIKEVTATQNVIVYVFLALATGGNYLLSLADLGGFKLAAVLLVAFVEMIVGALFYMHLVEQNSSLRFILPLAILWVGLLLGFTMLDVLTRYPPVNAPGARYQELPPDRPARVRVYQQGGDTPERMQGY